MKKNLQATSIIEAIVVLIVVVTGIVWVYNIMISSQRLSNSTADRIEAIQIARDGLEAVTNIRDTNWQLFAADYENCWNVLSYSWWCIWVVTTSDKFASFASPPTPWNRIIYKIFKNSTNQMELESSIMPETHIDYGSWSFRSNFGVWYDAMWFYTQNGAVSLTQPLFTRYLRFQYVDTDGSGGLSRARDDKFTVTAIVEWFDPASRVPRKLEMSTVLTNWKAKK